MTLPSLHSNRWVRHSTPLCWITPEAAIRACGAALNRERLARQPIRTRVWWWTQWRAVRTVRALFF